jgi:lysyl-tRNA synthetase class I
MSWISPKRKAKAEMLSLKERKALVNKVFEKMDADTKLKDIATALSRRLTETLKGFKKEYLPYSIAVASQAIRRYVAMTTYDFLMEEKPKKEEAKEESDDEQVEVLELKDNK